MTIDFEYAGRSYVRETAAVAADGRPHGREDDGLRHLFFPASSAMTRCAIASAPFAAGTPQ